MVFALLFKMVDASSVDDANLSKWMGSFADPPRRSLADMYKKWQKYVSLPLDHCCFVCLGEGWMDVGCGWGRARVTPTGHRMADCEDGRREASPRMFLEVGM